MRLVSQQCTQVPQKGAERPFSLVCVHSCVLTSVHNGATVYTNDPKLCREAILANLCTLLRPPPMSARATGRGHGSHDVDGPMTLVMPGRSDLRPTPPGRRRNHQPTRTHEAHWLGLANCRAIPNCGKAIWQLIQPDLIVLSRYEQSRCIDEVEKALKRVGLDGSAGARVGVVWWREAALLGRIGFARAMFKHTDVLYADEPTASLDKANRQMVIDLIRQRASEGTTVIIATHDDDLAKIADANFAMGSSAG